jgi:20S proteasome alpha/beta subunit
MSLVITLYVREGIVMASDSRLTLNATQHPAEGQSVVQLAVVETDSSYKTFVTTHGVGISVFGAGEVGGVPIGGFIESFMSEVLTDHGVDDVAHKLLDHFRKQPGPPATGFHVAGYKDLEQHVWTVSVDGNSVNRVNTGKEQGATWSGEADVLARLMQEVAVKDHAGTYQPLPAHTIPWGVFTLQDAIDFAVYAIRTTIDSMRFHARPKTVGGPIDVLVIKPDGASWIQRKELRGER